MLFWKKFPFLRITAIFCAGILSGNNVMIPLKILFVALPGLVFLYFLVIRILVKQYFRRFNLLISFIAFFIIFLSGLLASQYKISQAACTISLVTDNAADYYLVKIIQSAGKTERYDKFLVRSILLRSGQKYNNLSGKILIYLPPGQQIDYGNLILIKGKPISFDGPEFPMEFDYRNYMFHQDIYFSHFLKKGEFRIIKIKNRAYLPATAFRLREKITEMILAGIGDKRAEALMVALTTGRRDYFDRETYSEFLEAGIVHILAVSGLHVGIVYFLLLFFTRPLSHSKPGRLLRLSIILCAFGLVSLLTGLSPSVLRSVAMFSIVSAGNTFNRKTSILNSIALSAFILLSFQPGFLWLAGFQLSYTAVLGIILLQPVLNSFFRPSLRLFAWGWNLITVSLAAQLATLPVSLLYFKQFPTYFLFSNLIAIPFVTIFIPGSIFFCLTFQVHGLGYLVGQFLELLASLFLRMIGMINSLPGSLIYPVNINTIESILILAMILLLYAFLKKRKFRLIRIICLLLGLLVLMDAWKYFSSGQKKRILAGTIRGIPVIELIDGHQAFVLVPGDKMTDTAKLRYNLENYHVRHNIGYHVLSISELPEYLPCQKNGGGLLIGWNGMIIVISDGTSGHDLQGNVRQIADIALDRVDRHAIFYTTMAKDGQACQVRRSDFTLSGKIIEIRLCCSKQDAGKLF